MLHQEVLLRGLPLFVILEGHLFPEKDPLLIDILADLPRDESLKTSDPNCSAYLYHSRLVSTAGGENAVPGKPVYFAWVSAEILATPGLIYVNKCLPAGVGRPAAPELPHTRGWIQHQS